MNRYIAKWYEVITTKQVLVVTVVFLLFTALVLPVVATFTAEQIGVSESPDTGFSFQLAGLYELLEAYGSSGRRLYILLRWTFDVVWPLTYTSFLVAATAYFGRRSRCRFGSRILYVPLMAMTMDFTENIFATIVMAIYPTRIDLFGYLLFGASILKWTVLSLAFVLAFLLATRFVVKRIQGDIQP